MYVKLAAVIILLVLGISGMITALTVIAHANDDGEEENPDDGNTI